MIESISETTPTARKPHRCFHCNQLIDPGTRYHRKVLKYDGVYTLNMHLDCEALWWMYEGDLPPYYFDDDNRRGLWEDWVGSGEFNSLCDAYRGRYPHAVTRLELSEQKSDIRRGHWLPDGAEDDG